MANAILVAIATLAFTALALYGAYAAGLMDGYEKQLAFYWMKTKAKAQEERLKSLGKVEGVDFTKDELPGNKQAEAVLQNGVGGVSGGLGAAGDGVGSLGSGIGGGIGDGVGSLKMGL